MDAFFEELDGKIDFLPDLRASGRKDEALMLCCLYLDGLGNWLATEQGTTRNFCTALMNHGGEEVLQLVLPHLLAEKLPWKGAPTGASTLKKTLTELPRYEALSQAGLLASVAKDTPEDHLKWLESEIWRGAIANVVHTRIRSLNVHYLGSAGDLSFSNTTYLGQNLPEIDFAMLMRALRRIAEHARKTSTETNKWFGLI
ncbi:MAG: hypothetical protein WD802_01530 [Gemmatimonadaceae bacterium]